MNFKKVTHVVAVAFGAVTLFAISPAGQALVRQYPRLSGIVTLLAALGALYHSPKNSD